MKTERIYTPIREELELVEKGLKEISRNLCTNSLQDILSYFFQIQGKRLRPSLALLSAGVVNPGLSEGMKEQLIRFAVGIELMHSASLIHDDVIDGDLFRRGQQTLNKLYGKKIAVLAGDVVYSLAFSTLSDALPKEYEKVIVELTEQMCASEVLQAKSITPDSDTYYEIIKGKTALFMAISCKIAAALAGGSQDQINCLEQYGLNLGMVYQIMDDCMDKDIDPSLNITIQDAKGYADQAMVALDGFTDSEFKNSLIYLVQLILSSSDEKACNS